jgi:citrate lyase subunit beta/citryl-CoA lyase/(S)-citramalyl-CoA lyase
MSGQSFDPAPVVNTFRSLLFVPANRPERFAKALGAGADAVCIDLEDAVPPDAKASARAEVMAWLDARPLSDSKDGPHTGPRVGIRINGLSTLDGLRDVIAYAEARGRPDFMMVPKVAGPAELDQLVALLERRCVSLWPIIESAVGLRRAWDIAEAPAVHGILFGGADYSADVGCTMEWEALAHARGTLAAAAGGVQLLDVPHLDIRDPADLEASTRRSKALGFTGRACIHPDQVAIVNAAFTPIEAEIARARRVVEALEAAGGAAALLDGKLIERPVIRAAQRVLERAGVQTWPER